MKLKITPDELEMLYAGIGDSRAVGVMINAGKAKTFLALRKKLRELKAKAKECA